MTQPPEFALLPLYSLREHEEVDEMGVEAMVAQLRIDGRVYEPIWVSREEHVVLNGHHRLAALKRLGAHRAPAWVMDYDDPSLTLERWGPGPPITKVEVVEHARAGRLFPPKTTRHLWAIRISAHPVTLAELMEPGGPSTTP